MNHLIMALLKEQLPQYQVQGQVCAQVLASLIYGSSQHRYGALPDDQSVVLGVIQKALDNNTPIPILVPWGSRKHFSAGGIDIAEVFALKQIQCLQQRVQRFYTPGCQFRTRIEDSSGELMFAATVGIQDIQRRYVGELIDLIKVMGVPIEPWKESEGITSDTFKSEIHCCYGLFHALLHNDCVEDALAALRKLGWLGNVPNDLREYYYTRYRCMGIDDTDHQIKKLAEYLSIALVRARLKGNGAHGMGPFIQLSFSHPVPGTPVGGRNIYYRTMPINYTRTHIPPWRGVGYLITHQGRMIPKMGTLRDCTANMRSENIIIEGNGHHASLLINVKGE